MSGKRDSSKERLTIKPNWADRLVIAMGAFPYVLLATLVLLLVLQELSLTRFELPVVVCVAALFVARIARLKVEIEAGQLVVRNLLRSYKLDLNQCSEMQQTRVGYGKSALVPAIVIQRKGRRVVVPLHACFAIARQRREAAARILKSHVSKTAILGKFVELPVSTSFKEPGVVSRRYF